MYKAPLLYVATFTFALLSNQTRPYAKGCEKKLSPYDVQNNKVYHYSRETKGAQSIIDHVLDRAEDGCIIVMHDVYEQTADAVEIIVPQLISRGFELLTVGELACSRGGMRPGERYFGF
jgi:hypothetical protein